MFISRRPAIATLMLAVTASTALAVRAPDRRGVHDQDLVALPGAGVSKLRSYVDLAWRGVPATRTVAWQRLRTAAPGLTQASWDRATHVPSRIWGRGVDFPGSVANPAIAAAAARQFLRDHVDLLAPGSAATDFELVANDLDGDLRTIGMVQRHAGLVVVGGQVSFRFKRDRLFVIGSEALPNIRVTWPRRAASVATLQASAHTATVAELSLDPARVSTGTVGTRAIIPLVGERGVYGYRVAVPIALNAGSDGRWKIWSDPATGTPLVRHSLTRYATGAVQFDAVVRWPGSITEPRRPFPAPGLGVNIDGAPLITGEDGAVIWTGTSTQVTTSVRGNLVAVENPDGTSATATLDISSGTALWSPGEVRHLDAQLSAYIHAGRAKEYVRVFAPTLWFLDETLTVKVNIDDDCNAFSDGNTIHFFKESARCENTATLADVVYHEFGHSMHAQSLIPGAGFFDAAFSEGLSDYLAAAITGDPAMGRGFEKNDLPLRHLDPLNRENIWPRDISEIHATGIIFGGAMWDLRKALIAQFPSTGAALADHLYYAAVRRASSIPTTLIEILAADDTDGDISNGTPNECTIRAAFGRHGLRSIDGELFAPGTVAATTADAAVPVTLTLAGDDHRCGNAITGVPKVLHVALEYRPRGQSGSRTAMATWSRDGWRAELPLPDDGAVVQHRMRVTFADGSDLLFPNNRAEPWQDLYRGDLVPLYCTDFERDPFAEGWRTDDSRTWKWGVPDGEPNRSYSGTRVIGTGLSATADNYPAAHRTWIDTPEINLGQWSDVRLHYRRWLAVEDGFFDQASVEVDGQPAWTNFSSGGNDDNRKHHEDLQWIASDVSVSSRVIGHTARVRWLIDADDNLEFGGWTLDDVCIVANVNSVCGDSRISGAEECDLGAANADLRDTCRTTCRVASCGDAIIDSFEECDDGNDNDSDDCNDLCLVVFHPELADPDGCCSSTDAAGGTRALVPLAIGLLSLRRRRRHTTR